MACAETLSSGKNLSGQSWQLQRRCLPNSHLHVFHLILGFPFLPNLWGQPYLISRCLSATIPGTQQHTMIYRVLILDVTCQGLLGFKKQKPSKFSWNKKKVLPLSGASLPKARESNQPPYTLITRYKRLPLTPISALLVYIVNLSPTLFLCWESLLWSPNWYWSIPSLCSYPLGDHMFCGLLLQTLTDVRWRQPKSFVHSSLQLWLMDSFTG